MSDTLAASESPSRGEHVFQVLKERLLDGRFAAGEKLSAADIAAELGVSRQPVFDAFKRLSAGGFVVVKPHVGCRVVTFDMSDIRDYFHIFSAVEGTSAGLAAERRTDDHLKLLRRLHAQIGGLGTLQDPDERSQSYRTLNREFHSLVHRMCGSTIVETVGSGMYDRADFYINSSAAVSPFADHVSARHHDHSEIVAALEAADADAASAAAAAHIIGTVALIEVTIADRGPREPA